MGYQEITNLPDTSSDNIPWFITKKWIEVYNRGYNSGYIVVTGDVTVVNENNNDKYNRKLAFKNNTTFTACISKIPGVLVDYGEDLDVVLSM